MTKTWLDYWKGCLQCKDLWLQLKVTLLQEPLSLDPSDPTQIGMWVVWLWYCILIIFCLLDMHAYTLYVKIHSSIQREFQTCVVMHIKLQLEFLEEGLTGVWFLQHSKPWLQVHNNNFEKEGNFRSRKGDKPRMERNSSSSCGPEWRYK